MPLLPRSPIRTWAFLMQRAGPEQDLRLPQLAAGLVPYQQRSCRARPGTLHGRSSMSGTRRPRRWSARTASSRRGSRIAMGATISSLLSWVSTVTVAATIDGRASDFVGADVSVGHLP
jgi:hypothetical protein